MASSVDVCNLALTHIGQIGRVTAIAPADGSAEAELCARYFPLALRDVVELGNWSFATKCVALTLVTDGERFGWDYCYALPSDCARVLGVFQDLQANQYEDIGAKYVLELDAAGVRRLYTNQVEAVLRYTEYLDDPTTASSLFVHALSWHLASMLAGPIVKGDVGAAESKRCAQMASYYFGRAAASDNNQRKVDTTPRPDWISGRGPNWVERR